MKTSFNVAVAALTAVTEARNLVRMASQPTVPAIFALDGFSPAPTEPPSPEHVAARADSTSPVLFYNSVNTCGYISGVSVNSYYCLNKDYYCAYSTSSGNNVGRIACCGPSSCQFRTTCVNQADLNTGCNEACRDNTYVVKCTDSAAPYCNTVSMIGGAIDYACGISDIRTYQVILTTYPGQVNPQTYSRYTVTGSASGSSSSGSATAAPPAFTPDSTSTATRTTSSTGTAQPNAGSNSGKSGTPVGAIVGGVVGGVGALALVGIGILLFFRNKKKDKDAQQSNSPPAPLMSQPQNGTGPPGPPQYAASYPDGTSPSGYPTSPSTGTGPYYPPPQQGSPPNYPYSQPSISPVNNYAPQQSPYGQQGFGQQPPYQQAGSPPPPQQQQYGAPVAGAAVGAAAHKDAAASPTGPLHEAPTANSTGHRGEMHELQ